MAQEGNHHGMRKIRRHDRGADPPGEEIRAAAKKIGLNLFRF